MLSIQQNQQWHAGRQPGTMIWDGLSTKLMMYQGVREYIDVRAFLGCVNHLISAMCNMFLQMIMGWVDDSPKGNNKWKHPQFYLFNPLYVDLCMVDIYIILFLQHGRIMADIYVHLIYTCTTSIHPYTIHTPILFLEHMEQATWTTSRKRASARTAAGCGESTWPSGAWTFRWDVKWWVDDGDCEGLWDVSVEFQLYQLWIIEYLMGIIMEYYGCLMMMIVMMMMMMMMMMLVDYDIFSNVMR